MTEDVGQRLLENSESCGGLFLIQMHVGRGRVAMNDDAGSILELPGLPLECGFQSEDVEDAWAQLGGDSPDDIDCLVGQTQHGGNLHFELGTLRLSSGFGEHFSDRFHVPPQAGQCRAQLVVNLPRDADAFLFSRGLKPAEKCAQLFTGRLEFLLSVFELRHVLGSSEHADHVAILSSNNLCKRMHDSLIPTPPQEAVMDTVWLSHLNGTIVSAHHQVTIVRMDEHDRIAAHIKFTWLNAEDAIELVRPSHDFTAKVPVPTADMRQPLRLGQLTLALLEFLLGLLALCNVFANSNDSIETPCLILDRKSTGAYPADRCVRPHHAIRNFEVLLAITLNDGHDTGAVIGMDRSEK